MLSVDGRSLSGCFDFVRLEPSESKAHFQGSKSEQERATKKGQFFFTLGHESKGGAQKQRWVKSKGNPKTQHFERLPFEGSRHPVLHRFMKLASQTSRFGCRFTDLNTFQKE